MDENVPNQNNNLNNNFNNNFNNVGQNVPNQGGVNQNFTQVNQPNPMVNNQFNDANVPPSNNFNQPNPGMNNMNFNQGGQKGNNLVGNLFMHPVQTLKQVLTDNSNNLLKIAICILVVFVLTSISETMILYIKSKFVRFQFLSFFKILCAPVIKVFALAIIITLLGKNTKQPIMKTFTGVTITQIPVIISQIVDLGDFISTKAYYVISPLRSILSLCSIALLFICVKIMLQKNDDEEAFVEFIKVEALYYLVYFIMSFLGIYI